MSWSCPSCKTDNPDGGRFCIECGTPAPDAPSRPSEPTPQPSQQAPAQPAASAPKVQEEPRPAVAPPLVQPPPSPPFQAPRPPAQVPPAPATPAAPPQAQVQPAKKSGKIIVITLVIIAVVLIGVCVLGIIAAIAIPNFVQAKELARQRRSVVDIQTLATAILSYHTDTGSYPPVNQSETETYGLGTIDALQSYLVPNYMKELPKADGWGNPYLYGANKDASSFVLMSMGSDGKQGDEGIPQDYVTTSCYQDDILWKDNSFLQVPEGKQSNCK